MKISISTTPGWGTEPSDNFYTKDMTKGEVILDWLDRHGVKRVNGRYLFYHATPKVGGATDMLKAGTLLETNEATAKRLAIDNKRLKLKDVKVLKVYVKPYEIEVGHWASLLKDHRL